MTDPTSTARAPIDLAGLKPCPFCDGQAHQYPIRGIQGYVISCLSCGSSCHESDPQRVRLLWNQRTLDESLRAALAEAEAAKKALAGLVATIDPILVDLGPAGQDGWTQGYAYITDLDRLSQAIGEARALITPNSDGDET